MSRSKEPWVGLVETNLLRSALFAALGSRENSPSPYTAKSLASKLEMYCSERLSMTDMATFAALCDTLEDDGEVCHTSVKALTNAVYGETGGYQKRRVRESLSRLFDVEVAMHGFDPTTGKFNAEICSVARLIQSVSWNGRSIRMTNHEEEKFSWAMFGAMKATAPLRVELANWLAANISAGYVTWLDLDLLRALGKGPAARVWSYLETQSPARGRDSSKAILSKCGQHSDCLSGYIGLAPNAMATFGLDGTDLRKARFKLAQACDKIVATDPAWRSMALQRGPYGWNLTFHRVKNVREVREPNAYTWRRWRATAEKRRARDVRAAIKGSLEND